MNTYSTKPVEFIATYISLGWAIVLFTNDDIFKNSANFNKIESIVQYQWVVGVIALILALTKIVGLILDNKKMRRAGLLMSTVFWVLMSASFLFSNDTIEFNTGFVVYSGIAILCLLASKEVSPVAGTD